MGLDFLDFGRSMSVLMKLFGELRQQLCLPLDCRLAAVAILYFISCFVACCRVWGSSRICRIIAATTLSNPTNSLLVGKEVSDKTLMLEQDWSSVVSWLANAVEKLDAHIKIGPSSYLTDNHNDIDIGSHVVASFEGAIRMINNLNEKLDSARSGCELSCSSYQELNEKFIDLHGQYELVTGPLEESVADIESEKLLDPLHICDTLIEQLRQLLKERLLLKSLINEMKSDLIDQTNKIEELHTRCFGHYAILKLVRQVEDAANLEGFKINMDEPASVVESLIYLLVQRYKEANDISISCREKLEVKEIKFNELHAQADHIIMMFVDCENESIVYKESLKSAMEDLVALRSEIFSKVAEYEQSEQKVSSLIEKLSIAVAKGKGLIVQRDGLKHSLVEKSGESERFLEELQSKDA